ncbi:MAG: hypothetical protein ACM3U2_00095 [Deltaproteobacteria bacterium]
MYLILAEPYAYVDVDRAVKLLNKADEYGAVQVSLVVARGDPRVAEDLLNRLEVPPDPEFKRYVRRMLPEICYHLARADVAAAERTMQRILQRTQLTAEEGDGSTETKDALLRAQLFGLLAEAAVYTEKAAATRLLEAVLVKLPSPSEGYFDMGRTNWYFAPATVLATLLPVTEQADPALAREMFSWQRCSRDRTQSIRMMTSRIMNTADE